MAAKFALFAAFAVAQGTPVPTYWTPAPTGVATSPPAMLTAKPTTQSSASPTISPTKLATTATTKPTISPTKSATTATMKPTMPSPTASPSQSPTASPTQTLSNTGSDFALAFMRNIDQTFALFLFMTADEVGTGTVSVPGLSFSETFDVSPGTITTVQLPSTTSTFLNDAVENKGVRIVASSDLTVYGLNQRPFSSDAFLALPTNVLGTHYIALGYLTFAFSSSDPEATASAFTIVADSDDTVVTITPSSTTSGRTAGVAYEITLNALDVYQLVSSVRGEDLTGSIISSTKPIGVFSGGSCLQVPLGTAACDHIVEMVPPTDTWGSTFYSVPLAQRRAGDLFRVLASMDNTDVLIDDVVVAQLQAGDYYETDLSSSSVHVIDTTAPSLVAQYNKGSNADGVSTDPFQMLIPPSEQFLVAYTLTTPAASPVSFTNFINVIVLTSDIDSCIIDGVPFSDLFTAFGSKEIGTTGYSGAQLSVSIGVHNLICPTEFGAFAYGSSTFDSYGYPGGMALRILN